jgi:2-polyprenyl-3-methyl-5-hydroxy-6-metoxy-1,4-benzoquinol methylase
MNRTVEPELMLSEEQCEAYAKADFSDSNSRFVSLLASKFSPAALSAEILDLGCGDGDIVFRMAAEIPDCRIVGVDGSEAMLRHARARLAQRPEFEGRISFRCETIPDLDLQPRFGAVVSNSLLHHLHQPAILWQTIAALGRPGAKVFVMDLCRPSSQAAASALVAKHASNAPETLKNDFFNSLCAAFTIEEVEAQIFDCGLGNVEAAQVSDRHLLAWGNL